MSSNTPNNNNNNTITHTHTQWLTSCRSHILYTHTVLCYLTHTVLHALQYSTSHTNRQTHIQNTHTQNLSPPQYKTFFTLSQPCILQAFKERSLHSCATLLMACFTEISFQFISSPQCCSEVLVMSKWRCKEVFFFFFFLQSQTDGKVVVNVVCLSLVAPEEKQQLGEPHVSWAQETVQTSPDIRRGKSHRSGLPKCLESARQQVHQPINRLSPRHFIPGLIPNADGLWSGPGSAKARLCHRAKKCWTPSSLYNL